MEILIPIEPKAQARPRVCVRGKFAHAYKTPEQEANEKTLETYLKEYVPDHPLEGPVELIFTAALPIPISASKKRQAAMMEGRELPTKRPDLSNLCKQIEDAMTRLQFFRDDSQITSLKCCKIYQSKGFWQIIIKKGDLNDQIDAKTAGVQGKLSYEAASA